MLLAYFLKLPSILKEINKEPNTAISSEHTKYEYALKHKVDKSNNMSSTIEIQHILLYLLLLIYQIVSFV